MENSTPFIPIRIAQALGITLSTFLGGANLSISFYLVPRILESPAPLLLTQWQRMYDSGKVTIPPLAIVAASSYFYLAYTLPAAQTTAFWSYVTAGVLSAAIIPYTGLFMLGTNGKLYAKANGVTAVGAGERERLVETAVGEENAHSLVDWWGVLNLARGLSLTASGVVGIWTALNN